MDTLKKGLLSGLLTTWTLGKVIFPITLLVTILSYTPILQWLIQGVSPLMSWFGLSGQAAIPLVMGNVLNIYAAIGAMLTLDLTVKEVFILAVMLSFSHSLLIELSVAKKVGVSMWILGVTRLGLAFLSAFMINLVWQGGTGLAKLGFIDHSNEVANSWLQILIEGMTKASLGIYQLALIVIPLMVGIQVLKDLSWLDLFSKWMSPFTRMLGMKENTSTTLAAGLLFGLAFGAGVMIQAVKEDGVAKKDLYLAFIFLGCSHAVIEDTLIFIPLGIPVWPLLILRLFVAVLLTSSIAFVWKRTEMANRKEASYEG